MSRIWQKVHKSPAFECEEYAGYKGNNKATTDTTYSRACDCRAAAFVSGTPGSEGRLRVLKQSSQLAFGRVEL